MTKPATTTPADTAASAIICMKAPRMFRSPLRPEANSQAVATIDDDADGGNDHDRATGHRFGMKQSQDRLPGDRTHRDKQEHGVEQRGEDRRTAQAVGIAGRRRPLDQNAGDPGNDQAQHIGEVVTRVRQQRYGVRKHAEHELHRNECRRLGRCRWQRRCRSLPGREHDRPHGDVHGRGH